MYVYGNNGIYFDRFGVEHILEEIKKLIGNNNITNIYRIRACNSITSKHVCIGFIDFILKVFSDYTNLICPCKCEKNYKKVLKYFQKG